MQTLMDVTEALRIMNSIENPSKAIKKDKNGMMALKMQIDEDFSGVKNNFGNKSNQAQAEKEKEANPEEEAEVIKPKKKKKKNKGGRAADLDDPQAMMGP